MIVSDLSGPVKTGCYSKPSCYQDVDQHTMKTHGNTFLETELYHLGGFHLQLTENSI